MRRVKEKEKGTFGSSGYKGGHDEESDFGDAFKE